MGEPQLYTLQEVAARLKISERTVHNLLNSSELSGMVIARRWKFTEEDIQAYLKKQVRREGEKGARKKRAYTRRSSSSLTLPADVSPSD